jgi:large subunit ribosomal protein L7/L12
MMSDYELNELAEDISNLTLADTFKLIKILEEKYGIKLINNVIEKEVYCMPGDGGIGEYSEDEIQYNPNKPFKVYLLHTGPYKLQVVKTIKEITGLGLKESKDIADRVDVGPSLVTETPHRGDAQLMQHQLEEAGATVSIS